ncbi:MAG: hypothetical protein H8E40_08470, partial [Chloroflexi bacterium]|nr:hypothetical protein [Chloroflexota bacterium]
DSNFAVTAPDTPGQYRIVIVHCYLESCTEAKNSFFHGYEKGPVGENALITISVTDSKLDKESVAPTTPPLPTPTKEDTTTGSSESGTTQDGGSPTIGSNILLIIIVIALLVLLFIFSLMGPKAVKRFFRFILVLAVVSFLGYLFWTYGIPVIMPWFRQNISTIIGVLLSLVVIAIAGTAVWINRHKISNWIKEKLGITGPSSEITHINRGVSISSPVLGQAVSETEEPDVELLCNKIIDRINSFSVPSQGQNELFYHLQLFQWLKSQFPDTEYEKTIGDSRIDIAIQKIAIEVKGPTYDSDLEDLKYKPKYLSLKNNYFKRLICVLFEKHYTDTKYEKITEPLKQLHGRKVIFIQK